MLVQLGEGISHTDFFGGLFGLLLLSVAQFFISWGRSNEQAKNFAASIAEIKVDLKELKETVALRILPRQEYENRHLDLQRRLDTLENTAFLRGRSRSREEGQE